ncbi:hypothetical protein LSAT2_032153 [Lamellibrachia satsuma]|nr:hypothetical protein LSAT2_032153 [Lamellibrachia satsuma]
MDQGKEQTMDPGMGETVDQDTPVVKKRSRRKSKPCEDSKVRDHEETLAKDSEDPDDEEQNGTSGPDHEETSSRFSVTEIGPLWSECDNVPIRNLCWASQDNLLFASKGPFLLTFHIAMNTGTNHATVKCPEVKVKAHPPKLIGDKLGISALWWDQTKLFVSLTNGQVCCVNVGQDSSLTVDVVDIQRESTDNMKHVDVLSWQVHGVCGTPGGVYLCLLESPAGDYCHLTILEPLKLTLVLRADTDVASVVLKQDESLCGCIDALAQVKFILAQKQPLPESLAQLVKDKSAWPNLPIGRQKLLRFLLQAMKLANVESEVTAEDVLEADQLIMKSHLETALTRLLKMEIKPATDAEKKSLMLVCDWLSSCYGNSKSHDQHLTQKVIGMLKHIQPGMDTREKCEICEANISFTSYRKDQCPNGHVFARCCQTLLICHSVPYRTCVSCEALAIGQHISGSSWFEDLKTNTCTFCDGLLLLSVSSATTHPLNTDHHPPPQYRPPPTPQYRPPPTPQYSPPPTPLNTDHHPPPQYRPPPTPLNTNHHPPLNTDHHPPLNTDHHPPLNTDHHPPPQYRPPPTPSIQTTTHPPQYKPPPTPSIQTTTQPLYTVHHPSLNTDHQPPLNTDHHPPLNTDHHPPPQYRPPPTLEYRPPPTPLNTDHHPPLNTDHHPPPQYRPPPTPSIQTTTHPLNTDHHPPLNTDHHPPLNTDHHPPLNTDHHPPLNTDHHLPPEYRPPPTLNTDHHPPPQYRPPPAHQYRQPPTHSIQTTTHPSIQTTTHPLREEEDWGDYMKTDLAGVGEEWRMRARDKGEWRMRARDKGGVENESEG